MEAKVTTFQTNRNLTIVQLATAGQGDLDYVAGARAMAEGGITIRELTEAGSVNTLLVLNRSDRLVFLMDGDILTGAKQNRVLNTSVLLAPRSKTAIPVSCVEQGRWRSAGPHFSSPDYVAPSRLRAEKASQVRFSLDMKAGHMANQASIWERVDEYTCVHNVAAPTGSLADVFEGKRIDVDGFLASFAADGSANGMAVFIAGKLAAIDVFNRAEVYREYFPKLVRGAAMEVLGLPDPPQPFREAEARYATLDTLDRIQAASKETFPGVGVGEEERFEEGGVTGLLLHHAGAIVHLTALGMEQSKGRPHRRPAPPRP